MRRGGDQSAASATSTAASTSSAAASSSSSARLVRAAHQGEGRRVDVVHQVRWFQVLVVVMVVVVRVVRRRDGHRGRGRALHAVHRVVRGVGFERVRFALRHRHVHGRQGLGARQQGLVQAREDVALELDNGEETGQCE